MINVIPLEKILPNPEQPRKVFDDDELAGLAQSIHEIGVIQPIVVEEVPNGFYILHDGERRVRASRLAGLAEIPASIGPSLNGSGKHDRLMRALVANVQRSDLNPIEEAHAYNDLRNLDMTVKEISQKIGINQSRISLHLQLLKLDVEIQDLVAAGKLSKNIRVADGLLAIPDSAARVRLAQTLASRNATIQTCVKAAETLARKLSEEVRKEKESIPSVDLARAHAKEPVDLPKWDMFSLTGRIPPWPVVIEACRATCTSCVLRPVASEKTCRDCPAVELVRTMIDARQASKESERA